METRDEERLRHRTWIWNHRSSLSDLSTWDLQRRAEAAGWWYDKRYKRDALAEHLAQKAEAWHNDGRALT